MDAAKNAVKWEIEIGSDVYNAGLTEDGEMMEGLSFFLIATAPNGRRFTHNERFNSPSRGYLETAKAAAEALLFRVNRAQEAGSWPGPVGRAIWTEVEPAYGSEAYASNWFSLEKERCVWEQKSND